MRASVILGCLAASFANGVAGAALAIRQSQAVDQAQAILISTEAPSSTLAPCLRSGFYGAYGAVSTQRDFIYLPSRSCLDGDDALSGFDAGSLAFLDRESQLDIGGKIVWVGQAGLDPTILPDKIDMLDIWGGIQNLAATTPHVKRDISQSQSHFASSSPKTVSLIRASPWSLVLAVPAAYVPILDTLLPAHMVPVALPDDPYSYVQAADADGDAWEPVPKHLAENLANITASLSFDAHLDKVLNDGLDIDQLRRDVRWLTGEAPSGIESRHSFTEGAIKAAHFIKGEQHHYASLRVSNAAHYI